MHDIRELEMTAGILEKNDAIADHVKDHMAAHGILVVNEMGAPGVGKTTTLKNIFKHIDDDIKPYVIEGDIESDIDTVDLLEVIGSGTPDYCGDRAGDKACAADGSLGIALEIGKTLKLLGQQRCCRRELRHAEKRSVDIISLGLDRKVHSVQCEFGRQEIYYEIGCEDLDHHHGTLYVFNVDT